MTPICRDDLRYTDDVIATLQSGLPYYDIARALRIVVGDVPYHIAEVEGMAHTGAVVVVDGDLAQYLSSHTVREVVHELGISSALAYSLAKRHGVRMKTQSTKKYPDDPEWYRTRTIAEIAQAIGVKLTTARSFVRYRKLPYKRATRDGMRYPTDPAWYAARTVRQIAREMRTTQDAVRTHVYLYGYEYVRLNRRAADYPTDPAWWSTRTALEAAREVGRSTYSAQAYAMRHGYTLKPSRRKRRPQPVE